MRYVARTRPRPATRSAGRGHTGLSGWLRRATLGTALGLRPLDVAPHDAPARPGAGQVLDAQPGLVRQPAGERAGEDPTVRLSVGAVRRTGRPSPTTDVDASRRPAATAAGAASGTSTATSPAGCRSGSTVAGVVGASVTPRSRSTASRSVTDSPAAPTSAIGAPVSTSAPGSTSSRRITPSVSASTSTTAFAVSTVATTSRADTDAFSATDQLDSTASVVPVAISGIRSSSGTAQAPDVGEIWRSAVTTSSDRAIAARSSTLLIDGDASPPVTRSTGWSSQSKNRRWISSASQPP